MPAKAQDLEWKGHAELLGIWSSQSQLPFWMHTNTEFLRGATSNASVLGAVIATYPISETAFFEGATSWMYRDNVANELQRKELYVKFQNSWLKVWGGAFSTLNPNENLSISHKNFLFSGNARPLPGLLAEASNPFKLSQTFSVDWGLGQFFLNDEGRFVNDVLVHYKRLGLNVQFSENHLLKVQLQHYVQWGGTSPVYGELKNDFEAFIDVFTARKRSETGADGEIYNAVGNHMGTYLLDYQWKGSTGTFNAYHEHPFEDGSGTRLANFPDGIWGVGFQPNTSKIIQKVVYEYIHTLSQSGNTSDSGFDSYFRNSVYRTGWSYEGNIIGMPLIVNDPNLELTATNSPIVIDRVTAHHLGIEGSYAKWYWQLKSTMIKGLGTYREPLPKALKSWNNVVWVHYQTGVYGDIQLVLGADFINNTENRYAVGLGYRYQF
ncbi:MAG TPA: capsule assembly Wzi family protein [Flavobacteriaceae bacterium]|nr:hypothetical protein [Flavobacteriaceae bacterium]HQU21989.1 capsule assembly Wzi family protein [Flavobacteriaceae bacterium]